MRFVAHDSLGPRLTLAAAGFLIGLAACPGEEFSSPPGTGGTAGSGGAGGGGGSDPCGGCQNPTPICNTDTGICVACLGHDDCTSASAARCDNGSCVACEDSAECVGVPDADLCDSGVCVQCTASEDSACGGTQSCDLVEFACTDVAPGSVNNCEACTNDDQCVDGRCIPMDYAGSPHGYYCLQEAPCDQPFGIILDRESINGAALTDYCGIEEDLATCEAVNALLLDWHCSGTDGLCSPDGVEPETAVPAAVCRQVGGLANRCTYECESTAQCLSSSPGDTCGNSGNHTPPGWCGG